MPSSTQKHSSINVDGDQAVQLVYLCSVFSAVNNSCKALNGISYTSGDPENDRSLTPFQVFLCKLALISDNAKGGDTITAMVALKAALGPGYLFASNNRQDTELKNTQRFLEDLLAYVGENPEKLGDKALQKQILWRALEFNITKVRFYIGRTLALIRECIDLHTQHDGNSRSDLVTELRVLEALSGFRCEILSGQNSREKCLNSCEKLIKAIQHAKETDFSKTMETLTRDIRPAVSDAWKQLRHYFGRLHSYRQAAESIFRASRNWPELFKGFTVNFIPSSRPSKIALPKVKPSLEQAIEMAFPDTDLSEYQGHLEELEHFRLNEELRDQLRKKSLQQYVHCEVNLHSVLVGIGNKGASEYWNDCMFIATSKQPCRLCHYYFEDADNNFQVQSSHMNVYPKWRLPDIYKGADADAVERQEELLDDIIEQMQNDTLRIIREKMPQGKRNDSRTESRGMGSVASGYTELGRRHVPDRNSGPFAPVGGRLRRINSGDVISEASSFEDVGEAEFDGPGSTGVAL